MLTQKTVKSEEPKSTNSTLFIIEGHDNNAEFNRTFFPEIVAAIELANVNGCTFIDIISSYDEKHLEAIFNNRNETTLKKIILTILKRCEGFSNLDQHINEKIKIPCEKLKNASISKLLSNLNADTIEDFQKKLIIDLANNMDLEEFSIQLDEEIQKLDEELQALVNTVSAKNLVNYLTAHPEVQTVYALLGESHLNILYIVGDVIQNEDGYLSGELKFSERSVLIHFFGGIHGNMAHYNKLAQFVEREGYIIPYKNEFSSINPSSLKLFTGKFPSGLEKSQYKRVRKMYNKLCLLLGSEDKNEDSDEVNEDLINLLNLTCDFFNAIEKKDQLTSSDCNYINYLEDELNTALDEFTRPSKKEFDSGEDLNELAELPKKEFESDEDPEEKQLEKKGKKHSMSSVSEKNQKTIYNKKNKIDQYTIQFKKPRTQ